MCKISSLVQMADQNKNVTYMDESERLAYEYILDYYLKAGDDRTLRKLMKNDTGFCAMLTILMRCEPVSPIKILHFYNH